MDMGAAIDLYVRDMRAEGRMTSDATERNYRIVLHAHAKDVNNRDPRYTGRDDIKHTLRRWEHPNTLRKNRSILLSFYRWTVEEGLRPANPVEQTRRPRRAPAKLNRLTLDEAARMLAAADGIRERRVMFLGFCGGVRLAELIGLQGRHFRRPGWVWISSDIGKGGRERWIPVIAELEPVWREISRSVADDEFVLCAQRWRNPPFNTARRDLSRVPGSRGAVRAVVEVGRGTCGDRPARPSAPDAPRLRRRRDALRRHRRRQGGPRSRGHPHDPGVRREPDARRAGKRRGGDANRSRGPNVCSRGRRRPCFVR